MFFSLPQWNVLKTNIPLAEVELKWLQREMNLKYVRQGPVGIAEKHYACEVEWHPIPTGWLTSSGTQTYLCPLSSM